MYMTFILHIILFSTKSVLSLFLLSKNLSKTQVVYTFTSNVFSSREFSIPIRTFSVFSARHVGKYNFTLLPFVVSLTKVYHNPLCQSFTLTPQVCTISPTTCKIHFICPTHTEKQLFYRRKSVCAVFSLISVVYWTQ